MGKDAPCSSKTKLYSSTNKDKTVPPLRIKRSNIERHSPSPRPRFKCRDPPPVNPIADQVSEKDFQDLQTYKDIPSDPDTIKNLLQNNLSREKLLPRNQRGRRRFITQHIPDKMDDLSRPNAIEDANGNNEEIMQKDCVDDEKVVEEIPTEIPSLSTKEIDENILKEKIKIASSSVLSSAPKERDSPQAKKRRIEMVDSSQPEILETSVTSSPLNEVQNNLDRDSLSRQRSQSICSRSETSNDQENSIMDPNDSPTPRSKKRKRKSWGKKRGKRVKAKVDATQDDKEPKEKPPVRPAYWFLVSILVRRMVTKETGKKWTFLSAHDRSKLSANPKTGLLDHPFRISGRPEPFSKESASYCVKYAETVAEYTKKEKEYWKDQDMGPKSHDYERKTIDGKPRKAPPTKEYFQRILGGRPRSYSMTTYSEYQHIYSEKNRLDKPARNNTFFGRRSKSAERVPRSRTRLITTYNMRKFNVPNLNLESQVMFSFLRKYETGKFYQTFSVFWADYHKIVEKQCILKGKEFTPPTIYSVIPYEYKRLSSNDEAKIAPDSSKFNLKPWVTDCAEKLLELLKYDVKPLFPVIQPTHEELINHPIINSAAKSKLRQITYETLSLKQWFLNIYNGNEDALKLWEKNKAILFRKRFLENRYFGVGRINELLPKQYHAKTVNQIPDEQKEFLKDQKKWMYDKLGKLREEEEKHRKKEEEKQRKAEIRKLAKEAAKSKIVDNTKKTPIKNNKRKQSVQKGVRAKKPKYSDKIEPNEFDHDDIEFEITAESSKLREREFSPELTASYNYQSESLLLDQSCLSEASALGNSTTFLGKISEANVVEFKEEEITEEISLKLPITSSAANTYICPKNEAIVCDSLVTKAASKRKTFVEASLKAPRQKRRTKITVEIKKKSKVKAKFVIENKNVDSKFKKPSEKEKAKKIIVMPDKEKIDLSVSEPSLKNVEADIPLFAECISEEAADKLPQDIMPQVEKVSCAINLCKAPVPIRETEKLLQFEEVSTNESDIVKEVEDMTVQQQHIGSDFENTEKESLAMANAEISEDLPTQKSSDFADLLSENNESILSESVRRNTAKESDDMIVQKQYIGSDLSELVESLIQNVEKQQNISESSASVNTLNQNLFENIEQEPLPMKDAEIFEDLAAQKSSVYLLNVNNESILSESVKNDSVKEAEVEQHHHIIRDLSELVNIGDNNLIENVEKEQNISESSVSVNNQTLFENIEQEPLPMADDEIFEDLAAQKPSVDLLSAYNESILCESVKNDSVKEDIIVEQQHHIIRDLSELVESLSENVEKEQNIFESSVSTVNQNSLENTEKEFVEDVEFIEALPAQKSSVDLLSAYNESILSESVKNDSVKEAEVEQQHHIIRDLSGLVNIGDKNLIENVEKEFVEDVEFIEALPAQKSSDLLTDEKESTKSVEKKAVKEVEKMPVKKKMSKQLEEFFDCFRCDDDDAVDESFHTESVASNTVKPDTIVEKRREHIFIDLTSPSDFANESSIKNAAKQSLAIADEEFCEVLPVPLLIQDKVVTQRKVSEVPATTNLRAVPELNKHQKKVVEKPVNGILEPNVHEKFDELKLPLSLKKLLEMKAPPVPVLTEFSSLVDSKNFQTEQIMRRKNLPHLAFKIKENIVINCGRVGKHGTYSQAIISDGSCKIYDFHNAEWKRRMELCSKNVLTFDQPYGTRRSHICGLGMPSNCENDYEIVVFKHDFGTFRHTNGKIEEIYFYYTYYEGKLILFYEDKVKYDFDLIWAPHLQYFEFLSVDDDVFQEIVIECYNVAFDTKYPPKKLLPEELDQDNILFIKKQPQNRPDSRKSYTPHRQTSSGSGSSSSTTPKHGSTAHRSTYNRSDNQRSAYHKPSSESGGSSSYTSIKHASTSHGGSTGKSQKFSSKSGSSSSNTSNEHGTAEKASSGGSSTSSMHIVKSHGGTSSSSSSSSSTTTTKNDIRQRNDRKQNRQINFPIKIKNNCEDHNSRVFDSSDPNLVIPFDAFKSEKLKPHRRIFVKEGQAYMLKEHRRLISHYAKILEAKIREYPKINTIYTKKITDFPSLMIKLGTTLLFSDETDNFALKPVDEKMKDKYRVFMGNIVAVSLCDAMRILTCLFARTTPKILSEVIINFHVGERFKFAASQLFYNKPKPDLRYLDNALALSIFEYSKDTSTLTFFFIRHLINAFKYPEFMEHPDNAYKNYYTNIIDFRSSFYYAERIVTDTMNKFYEYITDMVDDLPEFPPNNMLTDLIPLPKEDSQLSRSITVKGKTFMFKYEYNLNVQKLNTIIPFEMFYPQKLDIIPLEIQCQDLDGNDYFMDPIIPRWIFMINNIIIIHPTTYRILYHTCQFAETYLFPFDNIRVPFFEKFRGSNGKLNFYGLIKSGMPIKVTDICTQAYLHGTREPFDKSVIKGIEETREWLKYPHLLQIDYDSGLLHSTWKTICTILRARHEHGLLSKDDSKFQSISTDLMRRFRLHEFELDTNLKIYIPNPPLVPSPAYIPVAVLPYKK